MRSAPIQWRVGRALPCEIMPFNCAQSFGAWHAPYTARGTQRGSGSASPTKAATSPISPKENELPVVAHAVIEESALWHRQQGGEEALLGLLRQMW